MAKYDTKKVVDACIHYYDIVSEIFPKEDMLSPRIVKYYKSVISKTSYSDNDELNKAMLLDKAIYEFLNNKDFNLEMTIDMKHMDKQTDLGELFRINFQKYESNNRKEISSTRWI